MNDYLDDIHDKVHPDYGAVMALLADRLRRIPELTIEVKLLPYEADADIVELLKKGGKL